MSMSFNQHVIEEFRANDGSVGGPFEGGNLLLLTTTGARSGKPHTVPLGYVRDRDGRVVIVASAGGAPHHPAWYHNLLAHPMVEVELGTAGEGPAATGIEEFEAVAVPAEGAERERLFAEVVHAEPGYGEYQQQTDRLLPVVVLQRTEDPGIEVTSLADKLLEVHTWLRGQLRHVRAEADSYFGGTNGVGGPGGTGGAAGGPGRAPVGLGLQLRQHCLAFCETLTVHHTGEDAAVFPAVARSHPHLRETLAELAEQHLGVARLRAELTELLTDLPNADPEHFRTELARMTTELEAHLAYEEEALLPVLAEVPFPPVRR
ncbi:nitroreductase/quinone reductase family protein [Kitasatospora sp. NPDC054939]